MKFGRILDRNRFGYLTPTFSKVNTLKILTNKIQAKSDDNLRNEIYNFSLQGKLSVIIKKNDKLHDRLILSEKGAWTLGYSVKDFGKKDCFISDVSVLSTSLSEIYLNERWIEGVEWK